MSVMTEVPPWWRGPLPKNVVPIRPPGQGSTKPTSAGDSTPPAGVEPRPTRYKTVIVGHEEVRIVVNPNRCMICHKLPHRTTPHHHFIPDEATVEFARALGWPMPPTQEPLL